jgi:SWIM/SEC-C metal-binding protein
MSKNYFSNSINNKKYTGKRKGKLGTHYNPALIVVQTKMRAKELEKILKQNKWEYKIEINNTKPEDISDLELLQNPIETIISEKKPGRNEPCPCGSGKKYKHCCMFKA